MDHEKHGKLQVLNGYTLLEAMHDSTTLEPTYEESATILREMHNPTPMEASHDENFSLYNHVCALVLSPTSYTSIFFSIRPNEVWVKGLFFMVPHEEYGIYISPFDDVMIRDQYYLHLKKNSLLHYDDTHLHGCTYDVHSSHLKTHDFPFPLLNVMFRFDK